MNKKSLAKLIKKAGNKVYEEYAESGKIKKELDVKSKENKQ